MSVQIKRSAIVQDVFYDVGTSPGVSMKKYKREQLEKIYVVLNFLWALDLMQNN